MPPANPTPAEVRACQAPKDIPDSVAQARAAGANTMIVGVANAGGKIDPATVTHVIAVLDAGRMIVCDTPGGVARSTDPRVRAFLDALPANLPVLFGVADADNSSVLTWSCWQINFTRRFRSWKKPTTTCATSP